MRRKSGVIQTHHIWYEPSYTVKVFKGEHWICTQLQRRKKISKGFLEALRQFIRENEEGAVELELSSN